MDHIIYPLKKRPIFYEEEIEQIKDTMPLDYTDQPQDLSIKRKIEVTSYNHNDYDDDVIERKRFCPIDLSIPAQSNTNTYFNPITWPQTMLSTAIQQQQHHQQKQQQQQYYVERRSITPESFSGESYVSRNSTISPIHSEIHYCSYSEQLMSPRLSPISATSSGYQSDNSYNDSVHMERSYQNQSPVHQYYQNRPMMSHSFDEPEDLTIKHYLPLPIMEFNNGSYENQQDNQTNLKVSPTISSTAKQTIRFNCDKCGKSYTTFSGLTKHLQFHCPKIEANQVKKIFSCQDCNKTYTSLSALKMHIRTHTLPCKCNICGKSFSRPWLLQGHIRTHTGEKPFKCDECPRAFADRSNLRAHQQTHVVVKKYNCENCHKSFSRMSLLRKHHDDCRDCQMTC